MIPFLGPNHAVSVIIQRKGKADLEAKPEQGGTPEMRELEMAMEDYLRGVEAKSPKGMADAFQAAFEICCSKNSEGPIEEEKED